MALDNSRTVCFLTSVHSPFDGRIFHRECKSLAAAGYRVTLVAQSEGGGIVDKVRLVGLAKTSNRLKRMFYLTWKILAVAMKEKAAVYHFHDPELIVVGVLLKMLTKSTVIFDVHEDVPRQIMSKDYIPSALRGTVSSLYAWVERGASRVFDHIVCATEAIEQRFRGLNLPASTVKNYISKAYVNLDTAHRSRSRRACTLFFAGVIYEERGILEGVKAVNLLEDLDIVFLICGETDRSYYSRIMAEDKLGRVDYIGRLSYEESVKLARCADIGYICDYPLQRHMEGLPVKLFEYMAAGIPVIASEFPLWSEIVIGSRCGLTVDPLSPQEIAGSIRFLAENQEIGKRMGESGKRAIVERYNWESQAQVLLEIYEGFRLKA